MKIGFGDVDEKVAVAPGLYEILLDTGLLLKVGIGKNLRARLQKHAKSYQSGLRTNGVDLMQVVSPKEVVSKSSILAKHLFFDEEIAPQYDLRSEAGRRRFLNEKCSLSVEYFSTLEEARMAEREKESSGNYRYCRKVVRHS